jgi:hypothetical protein
MNHSKNIIIQNTSSAALFQLTDIYFDQFCINFQEYIKEDDIIKEEKIMDNKEILSENYELYK